MLRPRSRAEMKSGPPEAGVFTPFGSIGVLLEIAMKNGIETIEAKSGLGAFRLMIRVYLPLATTEARSLRNAAAGEFILALVARVNASLKFAAVTASPLLSLR